MKKTYYVMPFAIVPMTILLFDYLASYRNINFVPRLFLLVLALTFISVVVGNLSMSSKKFDYIMTILMPLSFYCWLFIVGFFTIEYAETRHDFRLTFKIVTNIYSLSICAIMLLATFLASFKPIRVLEIRKKIKNKKESKSALDN